MADFNPNYKLAALFLYSKRMNGWVKMHRKLIEKAFYKCDSEKVHLWIHLLFKAAHKEREEMLCGKPYLCKPGQLTTSIRQLSSELGINRNKIDRILLYFEKTETQIEQVITTGNRLITIKNWEQYQLCETQSETRPRHDRDTTETRPRQLKEVKNVRIKDKNILSGKPDYEAIIFYLNSKLGTCYKASSKKTCSLINARWNEGHRVEEFKKVINIKYAEWNNDEKMRKFLRPETLFGTKFEGYLNQENVKKRPDIGESKQIEKPKGESMESSKTYGEAIDGYNDYIFAAVDLCLKQRHSPEKINEIFEQYKEKFYKDYPQHEQYRKFGSTTEMIKNRWKKEVGHEIGLMSFEEWMKNG